MKFVCTVRYSVMLILISLVMFPHEASAQREKDIGQTLEQFAKIAGGWYLNKKCKNLSDELAREFEWHAAKITVQLGKENVNKKLLFGIQKSARDVSSKLGCNKDADNIIIQTLVLARSLSAKLTGERYSGGKSDAQYAMGNFVRIALAVEVIMKKCSQLNFDEKMVSESINTFNAMAHQLKSKYPQLMEKAEKRISDVRLEFDEKRCSEKMKPFVAASLLELKKLEASLRPKK